MKSYETSGTVEQHGQVLVAGVPFAPGTEVAITIRAKDSRDELDESQRPEDSHSGLREMFERVQARNKEPIGALRREELYDRKVLR